MIKFFRKIRQKLLAENKFRGYLLYAIGEIILVVIGILIALQVNEWNKERNRNMAEDVVIEQLKADLKKSQSELEEIIELRQESAKATAIVCHAFWKIETPHDSIYTYMRRPLGNRIYSPTMGTAKSLISSGNISLIKSDKLKNEITSYIEEVDYLLRDISRYEETYYRKGVELLKEVVSYSSLRPKAAYIKLIEESNNPNYETDINDEYWPVPNVIEKIPFEANLNNLFQDEKVYSAYSSLLVAHRNSANRYNNILTATSKLLEELE